MNAKINNNNSTSWKEISLEEFHELVDVLHRPPQAFDVQSDSIRIECIHVWVISVDWILAPLLNLKYFSPNCMYSIAQIIRLTFDWIIPYKVIHVYTRWHRIQVQYTKDCRPTKGENDFRSYYFKYRHQMQIKVQHFEGEMNIRWYMDETPFYISHLFPCALLITYMQAYKIYRKK